MPAATSTTKYATDDGPFQQTQLDQLGRMHPVTPKQQQQQHINLAMKTAANGEPKQQMTRLTKWLCAIIFALVLVVLALVLLDGPIVSLRTSRANKFLERISQSLASQHAPTTSQQQQQQQRTGEAGRLLAAGSDDHFMSSIPPDALDDQDHTDQDQNGGDSDNGQSPPDSANQIAAAARPTRPRHHHRSGINNVDSRGQPLGKVRDPETICTTPGCVRAAAQILNNMDNQTQPCDDFYQFACGRWIQTQVIPDEKTSLSVFSQNTAMLNVKLRALIERAPREDDPPIVGQMRNLYASCMNLTDIEARGDEPLLDVLRDLGGWPVLSATTPTSDDSSSTGLSSLVSKRDTSSSSSSSSSGNDQSRQNQRRRNGRNRPSAMLTRRQAPDESDDEPRAGRTGAGGSSQLNWLDVLTRIRRRGFSHDIIIDLSVSPDVRNNRRYIIELDQSSLGLPDRSYYFKGLNDTTVAAYYNLMVDSAVMLGASRPEARRQMLEALEFETTLAKISMPREQRRNVTRLYNKMLAVELYKLAPNIDWPRYLRTLLKDDELDLERDEVIVKTPNFLKQIDQLLVKTDQRIIINYMVWRVVRNSMGALSRRWRELSHAYSTIITGRQVEEPRWEQCLGPIDNTLGIALSALYVRNHFNERSKAAALEMVEYIRGEFLRMLDEVDWMDEETREEAKLKARAITSYIGYPDELLQDDLIETLYAVVSVARTNFYQNVRNLRVWSTDYAFGHLRKPNKRGDWRNYAHVAVVNAYYKSLENSIEFPAGILQGAFFDAERPNYMNFGAIGYIIGHEITHGFDDRGRQFDKDGNDRNWWKPKTDARFKERAQCIIEQYGNYTLTENNLRVNGVVTQGENIADNGGIKEAYRAYRRWTKDHGRESRLPGLDYSADQLFWISAANVWCGKFRPEVLKLRVTSGVHSPAKFRVIGPLSNSPEFANSFNCPLGSAMNPHRKCSVW